MSRTVLGHSVQRTEDGALLDRRSPLRRRRRGARRRALGGVRTIDVRARVAHLGRGRRRARGRTGVVDVFTAADLDLPPARATAGDGALDRPLLARDRVRFVGEPVAVVVAATRAQAFDAAELVEVETQHLGVVDRRRSPRSHPARRCSSRSSVRTRRRAAARRNAGRGGPTPRSSCGPASSTTASRPAPMEPNGCVVVPEGERFVVWASTQSVFGVQREIAGRARARRGAGLGARGRGRRRVRREGWDLRRAGARRGAGAAARRADRVDRDAAREPLQHDARSRPVPRRRDRCAPRRHDRRACGCGASPTSVRIRSAGAFIPMVTRFMASGTYRIPEIEFDARIVVTNTTPTGPYRGAGRPEAAALLERIGRRARTRARSRPRSTCAAATSSRPDAFPYRPRRARRTTPASTSARSTRRSTRSDYDQWRGRAAARRRARGDRLQLGIGLGCYVEVSGRGGEYGSVARRGRRDGDGRDGQRAERSGPRDDVGADHVRGARDPVRGRPRRALRHGPRAARRRHVRLAFAAARGQRGARRVRRRARDRARLVARPARSGRRRHRRVRRRPARRRRHPCVRRVVARDRARRRRAHRHGRDRAGRRDRLRLRRHVPVRLSRRDRRGRHRDRRRCGWSATSRSTTAAVS